MDSESHLPLVFEGAHCTLRIEQVAPRVLVLRICGSDVGEFASAPMTALQELLPREGTAELYIDARAARGATIDVSSEWGLWLGQHKSRLQRVTMLTGSRFVHMTAEFVRRFSELEGMMRLCTNPAVFDEALAEATKWH